jgi:hypothetical protein
VRKRFTSWVHRHWRPICDVCGATVADDDPRCPHCGALFTDLSREYHEHMVTATWRATSHDELRQIGGWVHDAYFDWERVDFDAANGVVVVRFEQEPTDEAECSQPGARLVGRGRLGARIYRVPFVRCTATIRHATGCAVEERDRDDPGMLDVIEPGGPGEIVFVAVTGPGLRVAVDEIDVQIAMTDELAFYIRRTDFGLGTSDAPWDKASGE